VRAIASAGRSGRSGLAPTTVVGVVIAATILALAWPARPARAVSFDYAWQLGGAEEQFGTGIVLDSFDNVYVVGYFYGSMDVDPGPGVVGVNSAGERDVFVAKYSPSGALLWSRTFGGSGTDIGTSIATDGVNVYLTGVFSGTFNIGGTTVSSAGGLDVFVVKLNADGTYGWVRQVGGASIDQVSGISVSVTQNGVRVYVTGIFFGTADFDPGAGTFNMTSSGQFSAFILKLNANGNFVWARQIGGSGAADRASGNGVTADFDDNVYVTGSFAGTVDFDPGTGTRSVTATSVAAFVQKLDANGSLVWVDTFDSDIQANGADISANQVGSVLVTGTFDGTVDFDPGPGSAIRTSQGSDDLFVLRLDQDTGGLVWVRQAGGQARDHPAAIATGPHGDAWVTGHIEGPADLDPGPAAFVLGTAGAWSAYVLKLDANGDFAWARSTTSGAPEIFAAGVALDAARSVHTVGGFKGTVDFDPGPGTSSLTSATSAFDAYVWKLSEDGPTNSVPGAQTAVKDTPRVFSAANGGRISVAGQEAGSGLGVTLSATNGTLTLAGTAGLTFTSGNGTSNTTMTFTGRAAAVNAALDGLRYNPDPGYTGAAQLEIRSFLASQSGPLKPDTDTVAITVHAGACTPRPSVQVHATPGSGKLQVTVTPTAVNGSTSNAVSELRFGAFQNATVIVNGQPVASGQTVVLPPNTSQVGLTVQRATPGQPTTVPFTVVDGCGTWRTFVGGGASAGF
jgi:hypothetical protein